jgi:hypothetical protein
MKRTATAVCIVLLCLIVSGSHAQQKQKKFLFKDYPSVINISEAQLEKLFVPGTSEDVGVEAKQIKLNGPVTTRINKYKNLQTVVLRLTGFGNVLFSVSKRQEPGNTTVYSGRILNTAYADGYELRKNTDNTYSLEKFETEKIFTPCTMQ